MIEDIFSSPQVTIFVMRCYRSGIQHKEMQCISIDSTMRCCMPIRGQACLKATAAERAEAAFREEPTTGPSACITKLLTLVGCFQVVLNVSAEAISLDAIEPRCSRSGKKKCRSAYAPRVRVRRIRDRLLTSPGDASGVRFETGRVRCCRQSFAQILRCLEDHLHRLAGHGVGHHTLGNNLRVCDRAEEKQKLLILAQDPPKIYGRGCSLLSRFFRPDVRREDLRGSRCGGGKIQAAY